jgi:hypothetical protein
MIIEFDEYSQLIFLTRGVNFSFDKVFHFWNQQIKINKMGFMENELIDN